MPSIVAFDLDGTLANIENRLSLIRARVPDWRAFFRACTGDEPIHHMIAVLQALYLAGHRIEIWSGRSDEVRNETEQWLSCHKIPYHIVRMRQEGDHRPDHLIKSEWLDALPEDERPHLAFDDRTRVVEMWRNRGIPCCQVAPGDF